MKRLLAAVGVVLLLVLSGHARQLAKADIPFDFVVHGKTLHAGTYVFQVTDDLDNIEIYSTDGKRAVIADVITRLGVTPADAEPVISFDVVNGKMILESVSPPMEDGYLLATTKTKHTHRKIKIS